jgi:hypothetical protein
MWACRTVVQAEDDAYVHDDVTGRRQLRMAYCHNLHFTEVCAGAAAARVLTQPWNQQLLHVSPVLRPSWPSQHVSDAASQLVVSGDPEACIMCRANEKRFWVGPRRTGPSCGFGAATCRAIWPTSVRFEATGCMPGHQPAPPRDVPSAKTRPACHAAYVPPHVLPPAAHVRGAVGRTAARGCPQRTPRTGRLRLRGVPRADRVRGEHRCASRWRKHRALVLSLILMIEMYIRLQG